MPGGTATVSSPGWPGTTLPPPRCSVRTVRRPRSSCWGWRAARPCARSATCCRTINLVTGSGHRRVQSKTRAAARRIVGQGRAVTTPDSINEALVAGDEVRGAAALVPWGKSFPVPKDRDYWARLRVRPLVGAR